MGVVVMTEHRSPQPTAEAYQSQARWAKPMPKTRKNFIPAQSYLDYNWKADRDPDMEFALFAIEQSGMTIEEIERITEARGHKVSRFCLLGWFYKGVRRPQNSTISAVMSAIGWERPWVRRA